MAASVAFHRRLGLAIADGGPVATHHVEAQMPNGFTLELDSVASAKRWDPGRRGVSGAGRNVAGFALPSREAADDEPARSRAGARLRVSELTAAATSARSAGASTPSDRGT